MPKANSTMDDDRGRTKLRVNVLLMSVGMVSLGLTALLYAWWAPDGESAAAMAIAAGTVAALASLAREIVTVDSTPFDAEQAMHEERILEIETRGEQFQSLHALLAKDPGFDRSPRKAAPK